MEKISLSIAKSLNDDIKELLQNAELNNKQTILFRLQDIERKSYMLVKNLQIFNFQETTEKLERRIKIIEENIKDIISNNFVSHK